VVAVPEAEASTPERPPELEVGGQDLFDLGAEGTPFKATPWKKTPWNLDSPGSAPRHGRSPWTKSLRESLGGETPTLFGGAKLETSEDPVAADGVSEKTEGPGNADNVSPRTAREQRLLRRRSLQEAGPATPKQTDTSAKEADATEFFSPPTRASTAVPKKEGRVRSRRVSFMEEMPPVEEEDAASPPKAKPVRRTRNSIVEMPPLEEEEGVASPVRAKPVRRTRNSVARERCPENASPPHAALPPSLLSVDGSTMKRMTRSVVGALKSLWEV
jgi:hypothetical protein